MRQYVFILVSLLFLLNSCVDGLNPRRNVLIRVENVSQFNYTKLVVNTSGGEQEYGNLGTGQISVYKDFDFAYEYAIVSLVIDGEILTLQPIDYVGETKLPNGKYTYQIDVITTPQPHLSLVFIED